MSREVIKDLSLTTYASLPAGEVKSVAIFFHGYGADGKDLFNLSASLREFLPDTAFYFPDAPTPMGGMEGVSFFGGFEWFGLGDYNPDMLYTVEDAEEYCKGLMPRAEKARAVTENYVAQVMKRHALAEDKTAVCGFSQGGLMAVYTALRHARPFAGAVGLSAVAVTFDGKVFSPSDVVSKPPVTLIHGDADQVVPLPVFRMNQKNLAQAGVPVQSFIVPNLAHGIDQTALLYLKDALQKAL